MKNFKQLISSIEQVHRQLQTKAANAVNQALTIRNWLIGHYIVEFEQDGKDRAAYGDNLINEIAKASKIEGLSPTNLKAFRQFYLTYPQISQSLTAQFDTTFGTLIQKSQTVSDQLVIVENIGQTAPQLKKHLQVPPDKIVRKLSFSHLVELIKIGDSLKRTFYELECIKGTWSVREMKRQINSLYLRRGSGFWRYF